ncbi:ATP-binding protein, partial [Myxococcota bacterium]|nr:ATP-binding protein [Myxococcota bacterium]
MPISFPSVPANFTGREQIIAHFKARLHHYPLYIYEGQPGVGKTALLLKLARETEAIGIKGAIYLALWPGEEIASILGRVQYQLKLSAGGAAERQGDPFGRLADLLGERNLALVLDNAENLRREDFLSLVRTAKGRGPEFRIIIGTRSDPQLSAIDKMDIVFERIGPLSSAEVRQMAEKHKLSPEAVDILVADARRGGAVCHPLTLRFILSMIGTDLPHKEFLRTLTARSTHAFKSMIQHAGDRLEPELRDILISFANIAVPLSESVATEVFGPNVMKLVDKGMLDLVDGDIYVHYLVKQVFRSDDDDSLDEGSLDAVSKQLFNRGMERGEPMRVLRSAEIQARMGRTKDAIETLTSGWEMARDLGFLEAYLKAVAKIPGGDALESRIKLLSCRARMRKGNPSAVRAEMEKLAESKDSWTRIRANAAMTHIYSAAREHQKAVDAFANLRKGRVEAEHILLAGPNAAESMVVLGKIRDAEALAKELLKKLKGLEQYEREGELHRLLARIYSQAAQLPDAVKEAQAAAKAFEDGGDLYHASTAFGFIGDLYREAGDFEAARVAFTRFRELAAQWNDRDLLQVAELSEAWVALDVGDLTHAAQQIEAVEKEIGA